MQRITRRPVRGAGGRRMVQVAGAALLAGVLLAPAEGVLARPAASRELTAAEVEHVAGLPVGGQDCSHARDLAVRATGQVVPAIDTSGYYLGGPDMITAPGVASVTRMTADDPQALLPAVLPAGGEPVEGLGDHAAWRAESRVGLLKVSVVAVAGGELIATEVAWQRGTPSVPATRELAIELTRLTLAP